MNKTNRLTQSRLRKPYARILIPAEDGTYAAEILEFPGCYTQGNTPGEAIQNLEEAATAWIEAALEQGQDIPEPLASHGYSGKINLRLPRSIHKKAARFAQKDDVSLNQFFAGAIAARVGAEEFYDCMIKRIEDRLAQVTSVVNQQFFMFQYWPVNVDLAKTESPFLVDLSSRLMFSVDVQSASTSSPTKTIGLDRVITNG